jgi:hypothetical protein
MLTAESLKTGIQLPARLEQFERFLEVFDRHARHSGISPLSASQELLDVVRSRVSQKLVNLRGTNRESIRVEPILIASLKMLLDIKADEWISQ